MKLYPATLEAEQWLEKRKENDIVEFKYISNSERRTLAQNRLLWLWYREIDEFCGGSCDWAHNYCKLHFGVPILRRDSEEFRAVYDKYIKGLSYEDKMSAIALINVTSALTKSQASEYTDMVYKHWTEEGVMLTLPEDMQFGKSGA